MSYLCACSTCEELRELHKRSPETRARRIRQARDQDIPTSYVTHGCTPHPVFKCWQNMMSRCYDERQTVVSYHVYAPGGGGGTGVARP